MKTKQILARLAARAVAALAVLGCAALFASVSANEPHHHDHGKVAVENHEATADTREAIVLSAADKAMVLAEMRSFLESVQSIMHAATDGKLGDAAAPATSAGMAATAHMPAAMMKALPNGFKQLGRNTHEKFDAIAREVKDLGDKDAVLKQVTDVLGNCNACHQKYKLVSP